MNFSIKFYKFTQQNAYDLVTNISKAQIFDSRVFKPLSSIMVHDSLIPSICLLYIIVSIFTMDLLNNSLLIHFHFQKFSYHLRSKE